MKKIMVDMDNVITDACFIKRVNDFLGTDYKLEEQTDFILQNLVPESKRDEYWQYMQTASFYDLDCPLIDGAYEALEKINKKYELYITTAYLYTDSNPDISVDNLKNKYYYLKEKLPFISPKQYIFIENKNLIDWDIAIDDRIHNLENAKTKYLYSTWHNQDITDEELNKKGVVRVSSWAEIEKILEV